MEGGSGDRRTYKFVQVLNFQVYNTWGLLYGLQNQVAIN